MLDIARTITYFGLVLPYEEKHKYIATDADGNIYLYIDKPVLFKDSCWGITKKTDIGATLLVKSVLLDTTRWKETLVKLT